MSEEPGHHIALRILAIVGTLVVGPLVWWDRVFLGSDEWALYLVAFCLASTPTLLVAWLVNKRLAFWLSVIILMVLAITFAATGFL